MVESICDGGVESSRVVMVELSEVELGGWS